MTDISYDAVTLLAEWKALGAVSPGDRMFRTRRLVRPLRLDVRLGLREIDGAPCLIALHGNADERISTFETYGLRLSRVADIGGVMFVLSLEEPERRDLFAEICSDCIRAVLRGEEEGEADLLGALAGRLTAWRAFLRDQVGGLSRHEIIGLIGELTVADILLSRSLDLLAAWKSPDEGLHDFEHRGHSLEVKASLGQALRLHISSLDQLDETGLASLHIAHVRLIEQPDGQTLVELANKIESRLASERERRGYRNALLRRGLAPGMEQLAGPRVSCSAIDYYRVQGAFPRVLRSGVALGIMEAAYEVEVRALQTFAVEAEVALSVFQRD